ncbi:hypothetical protein EV127DRAFT_419663 [Xylaria flabelliformis]|nr:hypothetical protein EV127DRAFT_419663 [Xylaria flabelliformis]
MYVFLKLVYPCFLLIHHITSHPVCLQPTWPTVTTRTGITISPVRYITTIHPSYQASRYTASSLPQVAFNSLVCPVRTRSYLPRTSIKSYHENITLSRRTGTLTRLC